MTEIPASQNPGARPRFFYGFVIVVCSFLVMLVTWGTYTAFGVFFKPLQDVFGWSNANISLAYSISMITFGIMGFVMGALNDRFGPRIVTTISGILLGAGYLLMSRVNTLWQICLVFGIIIGVGMSGMWVPQLSSIARWFTKRRNLVTGIVLGSVGIGQLIAPPVISRALSVYDWRSVYIVLGILVLLIVVASAQFQRRDPSEKGCRPYGAGEEKSHGATADLQGFTLREAARTPQFYLSFLMFFCFGFGGGSFLVHIVRHAIDLGIPSVTAATVLAVNGGVCIFGSFVMGGLGDRFGIKNIFITGYILLAITMFGLLWAEELWMLYLLACTMSFAAGTGAMESPLAAWLFGLKYHGIIYGIIHIGFTAGASLGPLFMGYIFDVHGSYRIAFLIGGIIALIGIIITILLRPTVKKDRISV
jgi:MFS family permease